MAPPEPSEGAKEESTLGPWDWGDPIFLPARTRVRGGLSAGYSYNLADPDQRRGGNDLRLSDPDHNSFALTHGVLSLERTVDRTADLDFGYALDFAVGRSVETTFTDGLLRTRGFAVGQANASLHVGRLTVGVGKRYSPFGHESIDLTRNFHQSLSYALETAPRTLTGAWAEFELLEGVTYTQYLANGNDLAIDDNDAKSLAGQFRLASHQGELTFGYLVGAERFDSEADLRWLVEATGRLNLPKGFELSGLVRYGQEEVSGESQEFALAQVGVRATAFEGLLEAGLRASYLIDEDGLVTGREQSLLELTATAEVRPHSAIGFGVEYRHDRSTKSDAFGGSRGPSTRSAQDTLLLFMRVRF